MLNFSDGLRHLYVAKINEVSFDISHGINHWLTDGKDFLTTQDAINNDFTITTYNLNDFLKPYCSDINRLSCAAIESLNNIDQHPKSPKSLGWTITKYYYSAFFSAHCILRILGHAVANIQDISLAKVKRVISNYGFTHGNLNSGQYCVTVNPSLNSFRFNKNPIYDNSHEGLWRAFLDLLNELGPEIFNNLPQSDAVKLTDQIDNLKDALVYWGSNGGNWLSRIRNQVNYSQDYGVWFPYTNYETMLDTILTYQSLSKQNATLIDIKKDKGKDLLYFVKACQTINAINFELLIDLKARHPLNKSFVLNGIIKYHRLFLNKTTFNTGLINHT